MRLRRTPLIDPSELYREILFSGLIFPWKSIALESDSASSYHQRPLINHPALAELYHENSKLWADVEPEFTFSRLDVKRLREEFVHNRAKSLRACISRLGTLPSPLDEVVGRLPQVLSLSLFYAVELRVKLGLELRTIEPVYSASLAYKTLTPEEELRLNSAFGYTTCRVPTSQDTGFLFILTSFARNDVLFGNRGYRLSILEAGRVCQALTKLLEEAGISVEVVTEFSDRTVDGALEVDGIEEGCVIVLMLKGLGSWTI